MSVVPSCCTGRVRAEPAQHSYSYSGPGQEGGRHIRAPLQSRGRQMRDPWVEGGDGAGIAVEASSLEAGSAPPPNRGSPTLIGKWWCGGDNPLQYPGARGTAQSAAARLARPPERSIVHAFHFASLHFPANHSVCKVCCV